MTFPSIEVPKVLISPSALYDYHQCPARFRISRSKIEEREREKIDLTVEQLRQKRMSEMTDAMRDGLLFEGYVFGFKGGDEEQKILEGKKKSDSLNLLKKQAEFIKPVFFKNKVLQGETYKQVLYESNLYKIRGEIDYFGEIDTNYLAEISGETDKAKLQFLENGIFDLKKCANVSRVWDDKEEREELGQSIFYPYILEKHTGEYYPFAYIIVDSEGQTPIVRVLVVNHNETDFAFAENLLKTVSNDFFLNAKTSPETCGGKKLSQKRCKYASECAEGRQYLGGVKSLTFKNS